MASKKKLLQAAAGSAGGAGLDVDEVFSTYLYTGNGSTQNINNGINIGNNIAGSVDFDGAGDSLESSSHSFAYGTGDFTVEFWVYFDSVSGTQNIFDNRSGGSTGFMIGINSSSILRFFWNSADRIEDSATVSTGQWYHIAVARSSNTVKMFKNGTQIGSDYTSAPGFTSSVLEIGQRSTTDGLEFDGKLSNVRVVLGTAVYTSNFTTPTEPLTAISGTELLICTANNLEDEGPNKIAFTVKGDPQVLSSSPFTGNTGEGGLVWIKERDNAESHQLTDTERGNTKVLSSDSTSAEGTVTTRVTGFNSNGFGLGSNASVNQSSTGYASWTFRKAPKFFDVVTWTGNGTASREISHNLGSVPGIIIIKRTSAVSAWYTWHRSTTNSYYTLDSTDEGATDSTKYYFGDGTNVVAPTSTEFTTQANNENGFTYVAYVFAHNNSDGEFGPDGDQDIIKCGSYGGATQPNAINLGFEPQWLLIKNATTSVGDWYIYDSMRGVPTGSGDKEIEANDSAAEAASSGGGQDWVDFNATGFTLKDNYEGVNQSGKTYIYMAIRRGSLNVPDDATKVFAIDQPGQTSPTPPRQTSGFPVDFFFWKAHTGTQTWRLFDRLRGKVMLAPNSTEAETANTYAGFAQDQSLGIGSSSDSATDEIMYMWKRAPSYFDAVAYSGNGTAGRTVSHNLTVAPEMMWVKNRDATQSWIAWHKAIANTEYFLLNATNAKATGTWAWNSTSPNATSFTLGSDVINNGSGNDYIAYLFASLPGISKVGSYTGNGTSQTIDCGFTSGARFVLIKRTNGTGNWIVFDTQRGIVSGNDPHLFLNTTDAEVTSYDLVDPASSGFAVHRDGNAYDYQETNASGANYIFYAIA